MYSRLAERRLGWNTRIHLVRYMLPLINITIRRLARGTPTAQPIRGYDGQQ